MIVPYDSIDYPSRHGRYYHLLTPALWMLRKMLIRASVHPLLHLRPSTLDLYSNIHYYSPSQITLAIYITTTSSTTISIDCCHKRPATSLRMNILAIIRVITTTDDTRPSLLHSFTIHLVPSIIPSIINHLTLFPFNQLYLLLILLLFNILVNSILVNIHATVTCPLLLLLL